MLIKSPSHAYLEKIELGHMVAIFSVLLRNLHIDFYWLTVSQAVNRVPLSPYSREHVLCVFLVATILTGVKWNLEAV